MFIRKGITGILREVAAEVQKAVDPLAGTKEAGKFVKMGADGTPTVRVDAVAEEAAFEVLKRNEISMVVLSEESGVVSIGGSPEYICVLDPVDGTYNAVHDIPIYAVSIAIADYKENASTKDLEFGLVMNLETGDVFEAQKGKGASFNGKNISTSRGKSLDEATFGIYVQNDIEKLNGLLKGVKRIRNMGSVALELCHVAKGDYHGLVDLRNVLRVTDVAAGQLILEEAGGIISNGTSVLDTGILSLKGISVVACGNEELYRNVSKLLGEQR